MKSRRVVMIRCLVVVGLLGAVVPAVVADSGGDPPSWCAYMGAPTTARGASENQPVNLLPRQARYDVDLLGNLAHGTLDLEFFNPGEAELSLKFFARSVAGLQLTVLGTAPDETAESELLKHEFARSGGSGRGSTRGKPAKVSGGDQQGFGTDEVQIGAEESVWVRVGFEKTLGFSDARFRLTLPTVSGSCSSGSPASGSVTPLSVTLRVHNDEQLEIAESSTHSILMEFEGDHTIVETVAPDSEGRTPFEFDYALGAANEPALSSFVTPEGANGERDVLMVFAPSVAPTDETVRLKEVLFVLDTSGSMNGPKLDSARGALGACLQQLNGEDRFNLVEFDSLFTMLFEEPREASNDTLAESVVWLLQQKAGGSTTLLPALDATLKQTRGEEHHRLVVVLTDGAIGDEGKVLEFLQARLDEARLFFVGVGAEPNREKVRRLAAYARGTAAFADDPESFSAAVQELFAGISAPLAWDLDIDWGGAEVLAIEPQRLPDLYTGRPVTVKARVKGDLPPTLILEAQTTGGVRTFETVLPAGGAREFPQVPRMKPKSGASSKKKGGR